MTPKRDRKIVDPKFLINLCLEFAGPLMVSVALSKNLNPESRGAYSLYIAQIFLFSFLPSSVLGKSIIYLHMVGKVNVFNLIFILKSFFFLIISCEVIFTILLLIQGNLNLFSFVLILGIILNGFSILFSSFTSMLSIPRLLFPLNSFNFLNHTAVTLLVFFTDVSSESALGFWMFFSFLSIFFQIIFLRRNHHILYDTKISLSNLEILRIYKDKVKSIPVFISIFDSLKIDLVIISFFLGLESLGNYVVISTLCLSLGVVNRGFVLYLYNSGKILDLKKYMLKGVMGFVGLGIFIGLVVFIFLDHLVNLISSDLYTISPQAFLTIWCANTAYWCRRYVSEILINNKLDLLVGISELTAILAFVLISIKNPILTLQNFGFNLAFSMVTALLIVIQLSAKKLN